MKREYRYNVHEASSCACCSQTKGPRPISADFTLRDARPEDATLLFDLGCQILSETPYFLREPAERAGSVDDMQIIIRHYTQTPGWCMVHFWDGETPIAEGVLSGTGLRRTAHNGSVGIGVLKAYWGRGVGQRLMSVLEERGRCMGLERLSFTVFSENQRARDFYKRLGYAEEGVHRRSIRWPATDDDAVVRYSDEVVMAKWVGNPAGTD